MTPSFVLFVSACALMSFLLALVVIMPWFGKASQQDNRLMQVNVQTFYERLAELEEDKKQAAISQTFYDAQVIELKRQLLAAQNTLPDFVRVSKKSRLIVLIWIPLLAGLLYLVGHDRTAVFKLWQAQDSVGQVADDLLVGKIDTPPKWATADSTALISAMQTNVHRHAYDPNRWMRLSELFLSLEASTQALEALSRAYRLAPDDDKIAMTYAQIAFFANEGQLNATSRQILADMLDKNPNHEGAMMLMAMGETRAGKFEAAQAWASRLRSSIAGKSGDHSRALASLDEMMATIDTQAQQAKQSVAIVIEVAHELLPQIRPSDVIFVSIGEGQGAPYAVKKLPVSELKDGKLSILLNDGDAMLPQRTLSVGRQQNLALLVNAHISHSGGAMRESKDLVANSVALTDQSFEGQQAIVMHIDQTLP